MPLGPRTPRYLSEAEETQLLQECEVGASQGEWINVSEFHQAYEEKTGRTISRTTLYSHSAIREAGRMATLCNTWPRRDY